MAKCNFDFYFSGHIDLFLKNIQEKIKTAGGIFNGNKESGEISISTPIGNIKGAYQIADNKINIVIIEKPMLLSCGKIKSKLKEYI